MISIKNLVILGCGVGQCLKFDSDPTKEFSDYLFVAGFYRKLDTNNNNAIQYINSGKILSVNLEPRIYTIYTH